MALSQGNDEGTLTGAATQDTIRTSGGNETVWVQFRNYSGASVTLYVWVGDGVAEEDRVYNASLPAGESVFFCRVHIANTQFIKAEASAANSIVWNMQYIAI